MDQSLKTGVLRELLEALYALLKSLFDLGVSKIDK